MKFLTQEQRSSLPKEERKEYEKELRQYRNKMFKWTLANEKMKVNKPKFGKTKEGK